MNKWPEIIYAQSQNPNCSALLDTAVRSATTVFGIRPELIFVLLPTKVRTLADATPRPDLAWPDLALPVAWPDLTSSARPLPCPTLSASVPPAVSKPLGPGLRRLPPLQDA